jgi:hypothetical protein
MSSRQAVYVILFSVMEERDCMLQQVACSHMALLLLLLIAFQGQILAKYRFVALYEVQPLAACWLKNRSNFGRPRGDSRSHQVQQHLPPKF